MGRGGGGGGGGFRMDPESIWQGLQRITNSTGDSVDLSQIPPEMRAMMSGMAQRMGTNPLPESGTMSKDQFLEFNARNEAIRAANGGGGWGQGGRGMGGPNGGWGQGPGGWGQGPGGWDPNQRPFDKKQTEEEKPVAMRYGKLPKDLPPWFDEYDLDKDGQISLYEYRKSGKDSKEALTKDFLKMDLNGDGLLTADELLRFTQQKAIKDKIDAYDESGGTERPTHWGLGAPVDDKGDNRGKGGPGGGKGGPGGGGPGGGGKGGPGGGPGGGWPGGGGMGGPGGGMGWPGGGGPGGGGWGGGGRPGGGPGGGWPGGGGDTGWSGDESGGDMSGPKGSGPGGRGGDNTKGPDPKGGDNGGGRNRGKKGP